MKVRGALLLAEARLVIIKSGTTSVVACIVAVRKRPIAKKGWVNAWKKRNTAIGNALGAMFTEVRKANERRTTAVRDGKSSVFETCW